MDHRLVFTSLTLLLLSNKVTLATQNIPTSQTPPLEATYDRYFHHLDQEECHNNSPEGRCHDRNSRPSSPSPQVDGLTPLDSSFQQIETADSESLRQVLLLHRHGDRTPISFPPKDTTVGEPFWAFHGYGQLTNRGKARLFLLGKLIRGRYNNFLGGLVNKNQRITRASGALRCIESAATFLSAFLELNTPESSDARDLIWDRPENKLASLWQPASVQSVPPAIDGMLAESADCQTLLNEYDSIDQSEMVRQVNEKFKHESQILNETLGFTTESFYKWFWASSQIEVESSYFRDKVPKELLAAFKRIDEASNLMLGAYQSTARSRRLRSGLLMNDMVENMRQLREQTSKNNSPPGADEPATRTSVAAKKFVHYSAHDVTLVALLGVLDQWKTFPYRPDYAANLAIELHEEANEWFVRLFYMPKVPGPLHELHLANCEASHPTGARCTLDRFEAMVKAYMVPSWQQWMQECGNNLSSINPYAPSS